jgi:hypothetical protein
LSGDINSQTSSKTEHLIDQISPETEEQHVRTSENDPKL